MKFSCPKCTTRYSISDAKVPLGKTLRFTCKKCSNIFRIKRRPKTSEAQEPAAQKRAGAPEKQTTSPGEDPAAATRIANLKEIMSVKRRSKAADAPEPAQGKPKTPFVADGEEWFVLVQGKQKGPLTASQVISMLEARKIDKRTYAWRDGMGDWVRLGSIDEFEAAAAASGDAAWRVVTAKKDAPTKAAAQAASARPAADSMPIDETVAMDASRLREELAKLQQDATDPEAESLPKALSDDSAALASLVGEPTGDKIVREDSDVRAAALADFTPVGAPDDMFAADSSRFDTDSRAGRDASYFNAAPGEATRIFMVTAGLYKRRRIQKVAAVSGVVFSLSLITVVALDIAGFIEIPGMGVMYDVTGLEDPNADRAIERTEARLQERDLPLNERARLEKEREALRAKLLGTPKEAEVKPKTKTARHDPKESTVGIEDAKNVDKDDHDLMAAIMADDRKTSRAPVLKPPTEIQAPNLPEGLTQDSIFEVINRNQRAMSLCISQSMKAGENLTGRMEVEMSIGANGTVREAGISTERFSNTTIGKCTVKTVKRWKFPAFNGQPVTVIFPYVLSAAF